MSALSSCARLGYISVGWIASHPTASAAHSYSIGDTWRRRCCARFLVASAGCMVLCLCLVPRHLPGGLVFSASRLDHARRWRCQLCFVVVCTCLAVAFALYVCSCVARCASSVDARTWVLVGLRWRASVCYSCLHMRPTHFPVSLPFHCCFGPCYVCFQ